jgi:hypothetical protein
MEIFTDIDECSNATDECHEEYGVCNNTDGSYVCSCIDGYSGDGFNCTGLNNYIYVAIMNYCFFTYRYR